MQKTPVCNGPAMPDEQQPLLPNGPVPDGMVSVRFAVSTEQDGCCSNCGKACICCACCSCCQSNIYLHQYQIVVPEMMTVREFAEIAMRMIGAQSSLTFTCRIEEGFDLREDDPIGPTIKSYQYCRSPTVYFKFRLPDEKCKCLLI